MSSLLMGCQLADAWSNVTPDFADVLTSLHYQCSHLGIQSAGSHALLSDNTLAWQFETQQSSVHCEISRWHDLAINNRATEFTLQALCGVMSVHGRASGKAQALGVPYISTLTATLALQGAIAASIGQLRGLPIQQSCTSMTAAALLSVGQYLAGATAEELPEYLLPSMQSQPASPPFISADGVVFELETLDAKPWQAFWNAFGVSSQIAGKGWSAFMLRYAKAVAPIPKELAETLRQFEYARIAECAAIHGVAISPVRSFTERMQDADYQRVKQQGPWHFEFNQPSQISLKPATHELPLSGLTVIESCRRIQGPLAGHLLSLLGATVIRIEPMGGDPLRGMPPMANGCSARFDALNRHKIIREIDIKTPHGQAKVKELVRHADVFLHNWAAGKAVPLHLAPSDFADQKELVYAYAGGWIDDHAATAPKHTRLGTDFMTQAYSGVAHQIATASHIHGGSLFTVLDVLGGVLAAQGVCIALLNRCLSGKGCVVTSSLMSAATLLTAPYLETDKTTQPTQANIQGVYATQQGLLAIDSSVSAVMTALNLTHIDQLENALKQHSASEWCEQLQTHLACAVVTEDLTDITQNALLQNYLQTTSYTQVLTPWRFS